MITSRVLVSLLGMATLVVFSGCDTSGLEKRVLQVDGVRRVFWVHVPDHLPQAPRPLLIALHRFTETGPDMARMTGFNLLADRENFIVAYPDGKMRGWNGFNAGGGVNDVTFLRAMVTDLAAAHPVDLSRVYVTGASSGGYMAIRAAVEARDIFAAAAVVMASMPADFGLLEVPPTPVLFLHGTEDPIIPYDQRVIFAGPGRSLNVYSVPEAVAFWVAVNQCETAPIIENLPDTAPDDGTRTVRETYRDAADDPRVVHYRVEGGGHTWPGGNELWPRFIVGRVARDFDASEAIWAFLSLWSNENALGG